MVGRHKISGSSNHHNTVHSSLIFVIELNSNLMLGLGHILFELPLHLSMVWILRNNALVYIPWIILALSDLWDGESLFSKIGLLHHFLVNSLHIIPVSPKWLLEYHRLPYICCIISNFLSMTPRSVTCIWRFINCSVHIRRASQCSINLLWVLSRDHIILLLIWVLSSCTEDITPTTNQTCRSGWLLDLLLQMLLV